jgi:hypothetical protein
MMNRTVALVMLFGPFALASICQAGDDTKVKPQQEIQMTENTWGCLSKDIVDSVLAYEQKGQDQEKQQYFDDFSCLWLPAGQRFRVVSVDRGSVGFVNAENSDREGLWAPSRFIK